MRVLLNCYSMLGKKSGVGRYTAELLNALQACGLADGIVPFPGGWTRWLADYWNSVRPQITRREQAHGETPPRRSTLRQLREGLVGLTRRLGNAYLTWQLRRHWLKQGCGLYHEPNMVPLRSDLPTLLTIHDLSPLLHPQWHPASRVAWFEKSFLPVLGEVAHIIAATDTTRRDIIRHLNVPAAKVTRVYHAVGKDLAPLAPAQTRAGLQPFGLAPGYLLHIGNIEPRKNLLMLMKAYCSLPASVRERAPLVLAGGWGWNTQPIADYLHREARHRGVIHLGYVWDRDLIYLYNGARALVFPTWYEGFGFPPLEMLACGGPVIASTAEAITETSGPQCHIVAPDDQDGWRAAMQKVVTEEDWRRTLCRGGSELAASFTWKRCAEETIDVYRHVLGASSRLERAA